MKDYSKRKFIRLMSYLTRITSVLILAAILPIQAANAKSLALLVGFKPYNVEIADNPTKIDSQEETQTLDDQILADRIDAYFTKRNMPLAGYGAKFVEVSEKCNIDYRLLPAISVRESSGGKFQFNNNPFGWASAKVKFKDFSDAIDQVSDNLCGLVPSTSKYYKDKSTYQILWSYNGSVIHSYPKEVMDIMDMM